MGKYEGMREAAKKMGLLGKSKPVVNIVVTKSELKKVKLGK